MGKKLETADPGQVPFTGFNVLVNPRFWQVNAVSAVTSSVSLLPLSIVALYAPIPAGIGAFGTVALRILWGAVGAIPESAIEAGGVWNDSKSQGLSNEEADRAAMVTFLKNEALLSVSNTIELSQALGKNILSPTLEKMSKNGLVTMTGRVGIPTLTNAGEEYFQDIFTRQALGQKVEWDDQAKMAVLLGGVIGLGMGGGGSVLTTIQDRIQGQLSPELKSAFEEAKSQALADGLSLKSSVAVGLDAVAKTPEGKGIVEDVVKVVEKEEQIKVIKDPESKAALQAQLDALKAREGAATPTTQEAGKAVTPEVTIKPELTSPMPPIKEDTLEANSQRIKGLQAEKNLIEREIINGTEYLRTPLPSEIPKLQALYDRLNLEAKRGDTLGAPEVYATIVREQRTTQSLPTPEAVSQVPEYQAKQEVGQPEAGIQRITEPIEEEGEVAEPVTAEGEAPPVEEVHGIAEITHKI